MVHACAAATHRPLAAASPLPRVSRARVKAVCTRPSPYLAQDVKGTCTLCTHMNNAGLWPSSECFCED